MTPSERPAGVLPNDIHTPLASDVSRDEDELRIGSNMGRAYVTTKNHQQETQRHQRFDK